MNDFEKMINELAENARLARLASEKSFETAIEMSQHLQSRREHRFREEGQIKPWLALCEKHGADVVLRAFKYYLGAPCSGAGKNGTPIVDFCVLGDTIIEEMKQYKKAALSSPRYNAPPPSPAEIAKMSPWGRSYQQALEVWVKEHPNLSRAEAMESFESDDQYFPRILKFFHSAENEVLEPVKEFGEKQSCTDHKEKGA
jgi:hypothetical protein